MKIPIRLKITRESKNFDRENSLKISGASKNCRLKITDISKNYRLKIPVRLRIYACICACMRVCMEIAIRTHDQHTDGHTNGKREEHRQSGKTRVYMYDFRR